MAPQTGRGYDADLWSDEVDITPYMRKLERHEEGLHHRDKAGPAASQKKRRPQAEKRRLRSQESLGSLWTDPLRAFQELSLKEVGLPWALAFLLCLSVFLLVVAHYLSLEYNKAIEPQAAVKLEDLRKDAPRPPRMIH